MNDLAYRQETLVYEYIRLLQENKNNLIIFVSAKDTPGMSVTETLNKQLHVLGLTKDFTNLHWYGYCAVINRGKVIIERAEYDHCVACSGTVNGVNFDIVSGPLHSENRASITLNRIDYCINSRGLNFVIYDLDRDCVTDCVGFDTHLPNIPAIRTMSHSEASINKLIMDLNSKVAALSKEVHKNAIFSNQMHWNAFRKQDESIVDAKKRFFRTFEDNDEILHLIHLCLTKMLGDFDEICKKNSIQYWIDYGALLGAYRHNACIPWDDDLDVGMIRSDVFKLNNLLKNNNNYKIEVKQAYLDGYIRFVRFMTTNPNNPCFIDIFINDFCGEDLDFVWDAHCAMRKETVLFSAAIKKEETNISAEQLTKRVFKFLDQQVTKEQKQINHSGKGENICWACDNFTFWTRNTYLKEDLFPLKHVTINGVECYAPNNIEKRLGILYGDYFSLPNDIGRKHINIGKIQIQAIRDYLAMADER